MSENTTKPQTDELTEQELEAVNGGYQVCDFKATSTQGPYQVKSFIDIHSSL